MYLPGGSKKFARLLMWKTPWKMPFLRKLLICITLVVAINATNRVMLFLAPQTYRTAMRSAVRVMGVDSGDTINTICPAQRGETAPLASYVRNKVIVIVTHELTLTGAPFVCAELAQTLAEAGAEVKLLVGPRGGVMSAEVLSERARNMIPLGGGGPFFHIDSYAADSASVATSITHALAADLVIVSSVVPEHGAWLRNFRTRVGPNYPGLVWWVHEGAAVMSSLERGVLSAATRALLTPGLLNGLVFPSKTAGKWWDTILDREKRSFFGFGTSGGVSGLSPASACVQRAVPWGIPHWRLRAIDAAAADGEAILALRAANHFAPTDFVFLTLATFQSIKGYAGIFSAFKAARAACGGKRRLKLFAVGTQYGYFPQAAEWARNDVDIIIAQPTGDVAALLAMADAYVSNTQGGGESWGLSTLAALTAGKPVLASRAGASPEQMEHNVTALLHAVPDTTFDVGEFERDELASHMCAVAGDKALASRLASSARAHARNAFGARHNDVALAELMHGLGMTDFTSTAFSNIFTR